MSNRSTHDRNHRITRFVVAICVSAGLIAGCSSGGTDSVGASSTESSAGEATPDTLATASGVAEESSDGGGIGGVERPAGTTRFANGAATKVVASTTWVAAIAKLAGATDIEVIVPPDVLYPQDYVATPDDLVKLQDAEWVLFEGTERVAKSMADGAGPLTRIDVLALKHAPDILRTQVLDLSALLGTTDAATVTMADYADAYRRIGEELKATLTGGPPVVIAQDSVLAWTSLPGWSLTATFGRKPLSSEAQAQLAAAGPTVILEDSHVPGSGRSVAEASGAALLAMTNYPGADLDLIAVARKNAEKITAALGG